MCSDKDSGIRPHIYYDKNSDKKEIKGIWKISFAEGGPVIPGDISTAVLNSWTVMGDEETARFAGTARYTIEFDMENEQEAAFLDLGDVRDCARVTVNGKEAGTLLGPDYKVRIDNIIKGKNILRLR